MNKITPVLLILISAIVLISGCTAPADGNGTNGGTTNGDTNGGTGLTGNTTYSGSWSSTTLPIRSGTFEFTINFDAGTMSGTFIGDEANSFLTGSVSAGEIIARGSAYGGDVDWLGTVSADGSSVSGSWESSGYESGTWSGIES